MAFKAVLDIGVDDERFRKFADELNKVHEIFGKLSPEQKKVFESAGADIGLIADSGRELSAALGKAGKDTENLNRHLGKTRGLLHGMHGLIGNIRKGFGGFGKGMERFLAGGLPVAGMLGAGLYAADRLNRSEVQSFGQAGIYNVTQGQLTSAKNFDQALGLPGRITGIYSKITGANLTVPGRFPEQVTGTLAERGHVFRQTIELLKQARAFGMAHAGQDIGSLPTQTMGFSPLGVGPRFTRLLANLSRKQFDYYIHQFELQAEKTNISRRVGFANVEGRSKVVMTEALIRKNAILLNTTLIPGLVEGFSKLGHALDSLLRTVNWAANSKMAHNLIGAARQVNKDVVHGVAYDLHHYLGVSRKKSHEYAEAGTFGAEAVGGLYAISHPIRTVTLPYRLGKKLLGKKIPSEAADAAGDIGFLGGLLKAGTITYFATYTGGISGSTLSDVRRKWGRTPPRTRNAPGRHVAQGTPDTGDLESVIAEAILKGFRSVHVTINTGNHAVRTTMAGSH